MRIWNKTERDPIDARIAIWGATNAGKSSYLASLSVALDNEPKWAIKITPDDRTCEDSGKRWQKLQHPVEELKVVDSTDVTESIALTVERRGRTSTVLLNDPRGGDFKDEVGIDSAFWRDLAQTKGILYLFDPVRERESATGRSAAPTARVRSSGGLRGSLGASGSFFDADTFDSPASPSSSGHATNYSFLFQGIDQLRQICREQNRLRHGKLPHYLAVCLTKIDDNEVFAELDRNHLLSPGPEEDGTYSRPPVVSADNGAAAFKLFAPERVWNRLVSEFDFDRIAFFAVSSCGYYVEDRRLRVGNSSNVASDGRTLRRDAQPISVLSPFDWLVEKASR